MTPGNNQSARTWGMLCHLSSIFWIPVAVLLGVFGIPLPIPFLNILVPLGIWLAKKQESSEIDDHGKESLNFQISVAIYMVGVSIVLLLLGGITCGVGSQLASSSANSNNLLITIGIGLLIGWGGILLLMTLVQAAFAIFAAIKAKNGQFYRYPFTIRFLR